MRIIIFSLVLVAAFALIALIAMQQSDPCKTITVTTGIEVYTETNAASNRLAVLQPGDVIYLCGE